METVDFYFSFRSPYAWLAFHRIDRVLAGLAVSVRRIPVFPPPGFLNDPAAVPAKLAYIRDDVARIAAAYGLTVRPVAAIDTNWMRPHAAYLAAADAGRGDAFATAVYAARFSEGRDVGVDDTLRDAARRADVDPDGVLHAADDAAFRARVLDGMQVGFASGIFGVPTFVHRGALYWGNDRLEWVRRAVRAALGLPVPDLAEDPTARP